MEWRAGHPYDAEQMSIQGSYGGTYERVLTNTMNSDPSTTILVTDPRTLRMLQDRSQEPAQGTVQGLYQGRVQGIIHVACMGLLMSMPGHS